MPGAPGPVGEGADLWARRPVGSALGDGGARACAAGMDVERPDVQARFRRLVRLAHPDHGAEQRHGGRAARRARARRASSCSPSSSRPSVAQKRTRYSLSARHGEAAKAAVHVTVTGAAGQIGYALVHRIATGQLLGPDQPIVLRLLEIEPAMAALEGVVMELEDGAHPLLEGIDATSDLKPRVRRRVVVPARRFDPAQGRDGARRPPVGQRRDLQAAGPGDQRARGRRRARARRREPVQHELPHRPVERARRARRPLVRDDAARREPRQDPARPQGGRAGPRRRRTSRSGATTRRRSSPTS